ncbi:MAG: NAD(P)/FAD-dependent oxidoreductase [Oscillospiraceae bacterium]|nr:NAD(P)/FAD-dependent oxidoreductase [Oscillospiraceae bacterium]
MKTFDAIIIGGGPAGISAALYMVRANFSVAVFYSDGGDLSRAKKIDNYYGLPGVSGKDLFKTGHAQLAALGGRLISGEAIGLEYDGVFVVKTADGEYSAKATVLATGKPKQTVKIPGAEEFSGRGVSFCATCDGFFYRGLPVGVLGAGEFAKEESDYLLNVASSVTVFTNGAQAATNFDSRCVMSTGKILRLEGEKNLQRVVLEDGIAKISGLFVALGTASAADFAKKLGVLINSENISVDNYMKTNIPGLFAAGDCVGEPYQISAAVGEGAKAGLAAVKFLRSFK